MNRNEKKSIRQVTASERILGKTDKEIYESLKTKYSDKKTLAKLIAGHATTERVEKYKWMAHLVAALLIASCAYYIYLAVTLPPQLENSPIAGIVLRILPFLFITTVFIITLYRSYITEDSHGFIIGFFWFFLFNRLLKEASAEETGFAIALVVLVLVVMVLYNRKKYPSYGMSGPRRDKNGDYVL